MPAERVPATGPDLDAAAADVVTTAAGLPGVLRVGLALVHGAGRELLFTASERAVDGPSPTWCTIDGLADVPLAESVRRGRALRFGDLDALRRRFPGVAARQEQLGTRALASLPLVRSGDVLGGLLIAWEHPVSFDERRAQELDMLTTAAAGRLAAAMRRPRVPSARLPAAPGVAVARHQPVDGSRPGGEAVPATTAREDGSLELRLDAAGPGDPWPATTAVIDAARRCVSVESAGAGPVLVADLVRGATALGGRDDPSGQVPLTPGAVVVLVAGAVAPARLVAAATRLGLAGRDPTEACLLLAGGVRDGALLAARVDGPAGVRRSRLELPDTVRAPHLARRHVADRLAAWTADVDEAAVLACVSELVTNALLHSATAATLTLHLDHERLLCLVADGGGGGHPEEVLAEDALSGTGGRGLLIVEAFSDAWGWGAGTEGVTAWFSVARRSVAARGRSAPAQGRTPPP